MMVGLAGVKVSKNLNDWFMLREFVTEPRCTKLILLIESLELTMTGNGVP